MKILELDQTSLRHHSYDDTWTFRDGEHFNSAGDQFSVIADAHTTHSAAATVIFNGIPVFVVIGDKSKPTHEGDWRWAWPKLVEEPEDLKATVEFLVNPVAEISAGGDPDEKKFVGDMIETLCTIDNILEECGGEGHGVVAFVGIVADVLHTAFLNETPKVVGF